MKARVDFGEGRGFEWIEVEPGRTDLALSHCDGRIRFPPRRFAKLGPWRITGMVWTGRNGVRFLRDPMPPIEVRRLDRFEFSAEYVRRDGTRNRRKLFVFAQDFDKAHAEARAWYPQARREMEAEDRRTGRADV